MSIEEAAIARLDQALTRLEAALTRLAERGGANGHRVLQDENRRLSIELGEARDSQAALEKRVRDVSGRLDGVISELKTVLER